MFRCPKCPECHEPPVKGAMLDQKTLISLALFAGLIIGLAIAMLRLKWKAWFERAAQAAFERTDRDRSGNIDRDELYTGVLELYLTIHSRGVKAKAPSRSTVMHIMRDIDYDHSGTLDCAEFKQVCAHVSAPPAYARQWTPSRCNNQSAPSVMNWTPVQVLEVLTPMIFGRVIIQLVFTISCPIAAPYAEIMVCVGSRRGLLMTAGTLP
jgi:hypothetical protein